MQSPKFAEKSKLFKKVASASVLEALWKNSVRDKMRKQVVPDAVEFIDFTIQVKQRCAELEALIASGDYEPKPILRLKSEKSKGLCRQLACPSPEDALLLQALSQALWNEVEQHTPSTKAFYAPQDQKFAKQNPVGEEDEWGYGPMAAWLDFQREILNFSEERNYVVVTDIANYYDCILHPHLRSILSNYSGESEHALDLLLYILDAMLWRPDYMPNYGIGLPQMDFDAPRLLAHANLFEVDTLFADLKNVDFARFMDDMDFGVDTKALAKTVLRDLDLALQTRNLRLNSGKTKILTGSEALEHFRARDNALLEMMQIKWEKNSYLERFRAVYLKMYKAALVQGVSSGYFETGNGSKVLKRLINILAKNGESIPAPEFRKILYNSPGLRPNLFNLWARSEDFDAHFSLVVGFVNSGEAIDDLSKILLADAISSTVHKSDINPSKKRLALYSLDRERPFELYARLWIIARTGNQSELWDEIRFSRPDWSKHRFLSRFVAAFYGVLKGHPNFPDFLRLVRRWGGHEALSVLDLHESAATEKTGYYSVKKFVGQPNPSQITGITFPKFLLLCSSLWNDQVSKVERSKLIAANHLSTHDKYYFDTLSRIISSAP